MTWALLADLMFAVGMLAAEVLLLYGSWLCIGQSLPEPNPGLKREPEAVPLGVEAAHPQTSAGLAGFLQLRNE